jgi:nitric oxide dioxygenase
MSPEQVSIISATVPVLERYGQNITETFYRNMLAAHPELKSVFNMTNQQTGHQAKVLAGALYAYAKNIHNLEALGPMLELVCHKHASLHITADQYDIVGKYLIEAMQEVLGANFTSSVQDAWTAAYAQLAKIMIQKEASLNGQHEEWKDWRDFRIVTISRESDEISSFYLSPVDGKPLPTFVPGQYVSVSVYVPQLGYMQARQYSMSDVPSTEYYRISVKQERGQQFPPGVLSNVLHDIRAPGQIVKVSHPRGIFFLSTVRETSPIVLIAGGVGITPLLSMLKFLTSTTSTIKRPIHLIYATRTTAARAFFKEITNISRSNAVVRVTFFVGSPGAGDKAGCDYHHEGRLDLQRLDVQQDLFLNDTQTEYYICGPSPFLEMVRRFLLVQRVESSNIKMEVFGAGGFVETTSQAHL